MTKIIKIEVMISSILRLGVIICAGALSFGLILNCLNPSTSHQFNTVILSRLTKGEMLISSQAPLSISHSISKLIQLNPTTIITLGILLLIFLPILRVGLTVVLFFFEKDFIYFGITSFVLVVLISGMLLGKAL
jgi:uncharacterized membrane protein